MVQTGFYLGKRDWWITASLNVATTDDLNAMYESLLSVGCPDWKARKACMNLSRYDNGYTYTNYDDRCSLIFASKTTSAEQMFDTILHEIKHLVEHVSSYYGLDPKEELSAYLQGEVGRQLFPAASIVICPKCNHESYTNDNKFSTYR